MKIVSSFLLLSFSLGLLSSSSSVVEGAKASSVSFLEGIHDETAAARSARRLAKEPPRGPHRSPSTAGGTSPTRKVVRGVPGIQSNRQKLPQADVETASTDALDMIKRSARRPDYATGVASTRSHAARPQAADYDERGHAPKRSDQRSDYATGVATARSHAAKSTQAAGHDDWYAPKKNSAQRSSDHATVETARSHPAKPQAAVHSSDSTSTTTMGIREQYIPPRGSGAASTTTTMTSNHGPRDSNASSAKATAQQHRSPAETKKAVEDRVAARKEHGHQQPALTDDATDDYYDDDAKTDDATDDYDDDDTKTDDATDDYYDDDAKTDDATDDYYDDDAKTDDATDDYYDDDAKTDDATDDYYDDDVKTDDATDDYYDDDDAKTDDATDDYYDDDAKTDDATDDYDDDDQYGDDATDDHHYDDDQYGDDATDDYYDGDNYTDDDRWWENDFCADGTVPAIVFVDTGDYAHELAFGLIDTEDPENLIAYADYGEFLPFTSYNGQICLPVNACYELYVFHSIGVVFGIDGGFFLVYDGVNVMDIRPQSVGTSVSEGSELTFFGNYFGNCGADGAFGEILEPSIVMDPHSWDDDLTWMDDAWWGDDGIALSAEAPLTIDDTSGGVCGASDMMVEMFFYADEFSLEDNEVYLWDTNSPEDIWAFPVGSFQSFGTNNDANFGADYYFATCVDVSGCYEFDFVDVVGDFAENGDIIPMMIFLVDGTPWMSLKADRMGFIDPGPDFEDPNIWYVQFGDACQAF